jgi:hypothetical protein
MALDHAALLEVLDTLRAGDAGERIRVAAETMYQALIDTELTAAIGAQPWERSETRTNQRNGSRPRTVSTNAGDLQLRIPKLRTGSFFPSLLDRRRRVDQALFAVVMEAYLHGVSTRKVAPVISHLAVIEAHLLAARAHRTWRIGARRTAPVRPRWRWRNPIASSCRSRRPVRARCSRSCPAHDDACRNAQRAPRCPARPVRASPGRARTRGGAAQWERAPRARHLPTNLSRPEIAGKLCVSVNTVNTHIRNFYAKLQVPNRTAAVQRARRLRLLAAGRPG